MALVDDPEADLAGLRDRLEAWWRRQPGGQGAVLGPLSQASRSNGFSNETYRFTVGGEALVLRLPPSRMGLFPHYDIERQYRFMQGLEAESGLRMAPCRYLEASGQALGRPFFVTRFVEGEVAADRPNYLREGWIVDATQAQQRQLWDGSVEQLARLAQVRWTGDALAAVDWPERGTPRSLQHTAHWDALASWGRAQLPDEEHSRFLGLRDWLIREAPREDISGIVWGDPRFGNIIYRDFEAVALLDWELAVIGDPMLDIAYLLFHVFLMELMFGDAGTAARVAGFRGDAETLARWCRLTQRSPQGYRWCWLFNAWKMLCIWECKAALLLRSGQATLDEALEVRRAARLWPHIERVRAGGEEAAFLRPS